MNSTGFHQALAQLPKSGIYPFLSSVHVFNLSIYPSATVKTNFHRFRVTGYGGSLGGGAPQLSLTEFQSGTEGSDQPSNPGNEVRNFSHSVFLEDGSIDVTLEKPQRKGQKFVNPWPGIEQHGFSHFLKWTLERRRLRSSFRGAVAGPRRDAPSFSLPRADPQTLSATWIGHTSILLQIGGLNILTDPIWSDRASPVSFMGPKRFSPPGFSFDSLPMVDAVLISHDHYDHLDSETVRRLVLRYPAAAWRAPLAVGDFLRARGATDVQESGWYDTTSIGDLSLTCVPAQHFSGRGLFGRDSTLWCGWVLNSGKHSVFFAGDTALNPSFADIGLRYGPFDLALMPIGAYDPRWFMRSVHMDPEDCVRAVEMLSPRGEERPVLLATHWGTFKLTDEPLDEPPVRMRRAWAAAGYQPERLWIPALGESRFL